jgi:hypothetical protein
VPRKYCKSRETPPNKGLQHGCMWEFLIGNFLFRENQHLCSRDILFGDICMWGETEVLVEI